MEVKVTIGISEKLQAIAERFAEIAAEYVGKMGDCEPVSSCGPVDMKTCEIQLLDAGPVGAEDSAAPEQNDAQAQSSCEPVAEIPEPPVDVAATEPESASEPADSEPEAPKSKKSRKKSAPADEPQKAAPEAPQSVEEPPAGNLPPEPQNDAQAQASCESEPEKAKPADGDPYHGMTLLQAVQSLLDEIAQKGLELADVNARVRKECESRGLAYTSAACLMKAIGYDETRKIALG